MTRKFSFIQYAVSLFWLYMVLKMCEWVRRLRVNNVQWHTPSFAVLSGILGTILGLMVLAFGLMFCVGGSILIALAVDSMRQAIHLVLK